MLTRRPEALDLTRAAGLGDDLVACGDDLRVRLRSGSVARAPGGNADGRSVRRRGRAGIRPAQCLVAVRHRGRADAAGAAAQLVGDIARGSIGSGSARRRSRRSAGRAAAGRCVRRTSRPDLAAGGAAGPGGATACGWLARSPQRAPPRAPGDGARNSAAGSVFAAITGGIGRLPAALAASGRFTVRTGVTVRSIRGTPEGFTPTAARCRERSGLPPTRSLLPFRRPRPPASCGRSRRARQRNWPRSRPRASPS